MDYGFRKLAEPFIGGRGFKVTFLFILVIRLKECREPPYHRHQAAMARRHSMAVAQSRRNVQADHELESHICGNVHACHLSTPNGGRAGHDRATDFMLVKAGRKKGYVRAAYLVAP